MSQEKQRGFFVDNLNSANWNLIHALASISTIYLMKTMQRAGIRRMPPSVYILAALEVLGVK